MTTTWLENDLEYDKKCAAPFTEDRVANCDADLRRLGAGARCAIVPSLASFARGDDERYQKGCCALGPIEGRSAQGDCLPPQAVRIGGAPRHYQEIDWKRRSQKAIDLPARHDRFASQRAVADHRPIERVPRLRVHPRSPMRALPNRNWNQAVMHQTRA